MGQGLSLGPVIRLLGLQPDASLQREHAALARPDELAAEKWILQDFLTYLRSHYEKKTTTIATQINEAENERFDGHSTVKRRLYQEVRLFTIVKRSGNALSSTLQQTWYML